ncbi:MAG TPA: DUF4340 domain-containing protein [Armatimonadota bacterium]|nr:DUF4340 domain-containing protein [Armatimonadota bacterium]
MKPYRLTIVLVLVFLALAGYVWFYERGEAGRTVAWRLDPERVRRIELTAAGETTVIQRRGESWRITRPVSAPVDIGRVTDLLDRVTSLGVRRRIKHPQRLQDYGLTDAAAVIRLAPVKGKARELRLGDRTPDGAAAYAMVTSRREVILVDPMLLDDAEGGAAALRDRAALRFEPTDVSRISLIRAGSKVALVKRKGAWRIVEPLATRADADEVESFLTSLRQLEASHFPADDAPRLARYGLDRARLVIELALSGEHQPARLSFGDKTDAQEYYARSSREPAVMVVPQSAVVAVDRTLEDLRSRQVADFEIAAVQRIAVARGKARFEVRRTDDGGWELTLPRRAQADTGKVEGLLFALSNLRAESFHDAPETVAASGLETPVAAVTIHQRGRQEPLRLRFGTAAAAGRIYVRGDEPIIYEAAADILSQLPARAGELQAQPSGVGTTKSADD